MMDERDRSSDAGQAPAHGGSGSAGGPSGNAAVEIAPADRARLIARPCRKLFVTTPMPELQVPN